MRTLVVGIAACAVLVSLPSVSPADDGVRARLGEAAQDAFGDRIAELERRLRQRRDQLADAIMTLERFDRVEQATQLGRQ